MKMSPAQKAEVAALVNRLHDPAAAEYHKWLSLADIEERFGPSQDDIMTVSAWLESHHFTVNIVYRANGVIDFSGPASSIREAFHTEIHNLEVQGAHHIANISDPRIPAALAPAVHGVTSMNDFRPHTNLVTHQKEFTAAGGAILALVPGDMATIYDFNPVYEAGFTGRGETVVVVEDTDIFSPTDWSTFRDAFGLTSRFPFGSLTVAHPQPSNTFGATCDDPGINPDDVEAAVDMEWASAAAPNAAIVVASCADTNTNFGGFIAIQNLLTTFAPPPGIISISYGEAESRDGATFNTYIDQLYQLAVLRGVSVYVSAGDSGADASDQFREAATRGLNVSGWAISAFDVAVGGTDFTDTFLGQNATYWNATNGPFFNSAKSYIPEMPWDDSCANVPVSNFLGFAVPYGPDGTCNNLPPPLDFLLLVAGGSGGASSCFSGAPTVAGVVGGTCEGYPKPIFQFFASGIPNDQVRDIPDITFFAANGLWNHYYVFCYTDPAGGGSPCVAGHPELWPGAGGTSFGAPIMAGVQALINESVGAHYQGDPNFVLYALNAVQNASVGQAACDSNLGTNIDQRCIFHDVTFGDMDVNCLPDVKAGETFNCFLDSATNGVLSLSNSSYEPTYTAKRGYDFASGIGSADVFHLVRSWPGSRLH
jgi:subtilase family serine protease